MTGSTHWQQDYPHVAGALAPEYRALPEAEVLRLVHAALGDDVDLQSAEGFFGDVGRALSGAASAVAPYVAPIISGAASGAATGSIAGPWGALIGAGIGATAAGIQAGNRRGGPPRTSVPGALSSAATSALGAATGGSGGGSAPLLARLAGAVVPAIGAVTDGGQARPAAGPGGGTAVPQLMSALASPTVQQALMAMLLGAAGSRTVPTAGGGQVPVAAVTNMLASLATRASEDWEQIAPFGAEDLLSESVDVDSGSPRARASWLYENLLPIAVEAGGERAEDSPADAGDAVDADDTDDTDDTDDEAWLDEAYDQLEAELAAIDEVDQEADQEADDEADDPLWSPVGLHRESWLDEADDERMARFTGGAW